MPPSLSQKIAERWRRGRLNYKLHAGQKKIRAAFDASSANQLFVGECSRQLGKTIFEAILALEKAHSKKGAKVKIGTAFHTDLIEFILPAFDTVLADCPARYRPVWKSQQSKFVCYNGSEIKLIGLDRKPNGLRGTVIDLIILSEAGFIGNLHYLFKSVIIPATTHRPDCRIVMLTTPPETPAHEFLDYAEKAEYEGGYIKLTIYDNPMIDETTIARLMHESGGANSTTWRREYLCEHITDANLAIISDWLDCYKQEIQRDEYYPMYHKYVNMDLGVKDPTAAIFGYYDFRKAKYIIEDDFNLSGASLNTKILQAHIKAKELSLWTEHPFTFANPEKISDCEIDAVSLMWTQYEPKVFLRVSDNNNPLLLQDLSHLHNIHFIPTDKGTLPEMVNATKILVQDGRILVHPRCKQTLGSLKYGVWDKHRREFARSNVYGHFDALAALIYGCRNIDFITNPIPQQFKLDQDNQILFLRPDRSSASAILKEAFGKR